MVGPKPTHCARPKLGDDRTGALPVSRAVTRSTSSSRPEPLRRRASVRRNRSSAGPEPIPRPHRSRYRDVSIPPLPVPDQGRFPAPFPSENNSAMVGASRTDNVRPTALRSQTGSMFRFRELANCFADPGHARNDRRSGRVVVARYRLSRILARIVDNYTRVVLVGSGAYSRGR
jgi:hypothetical protein